MDQQRFAAALRVLQAGTTRRRGLAAALGVLLGSAGLDAADRNRGRGGRTGKSAGNPGAEGPCGNGGSGDNRCRTNSNCCTKYCDRGICRCKPNWMACASGAQCCSGACVDGRCDGGEKPAGGPCVENFNCQNGLVCIKRVCTNPSVAKCTPKLCSGCCDGTTCRAGVDRNACGSGGRMCARCAAGE